MNPDEQKQNYWEKPEEEPVEQLAPEVVEDPTPEVQPVVQSPIHPVITLKPVTWTAREYVHPDKSPAWYVLFALVVLVLIAFDFFFLKSYFTFSGLVIIMAVTLIIYIRRAPREVTYALSPDQGLYVDQKLYHFSEFKSFGIIKDGEHNSVMLMPVKRFSLGVSVFFPDEAGEQIVDILGQLLPMEELKLDAIDLIVRKLRL